MVPGLLAAYVKKSIGERTPTDYFPFIVQLFSPWLLGLTAALQAQCAKPSRAMNLGNCAIGKYLQIPACIALDSHRC